MSVPGTPASRRTRTPLRVSAVVELVSLAVLLVNLATVDVRQIAALFGPVHGIAWLFGVLATWRDPRRTLGIAVCAVVPGVGGMLALRALNRADTRAGDLSGPLASARHATRGRT